MGCLAVYVMLCTPMSREIFSLLIHDGLIVISRLKFTSVFGLCSFTWTFLSFSGISCNWFWGHISRGVGYPVREKIYEFNRLKKLLLTYANAVIISMPFSIAATGSNISSRSLIATFFESALLAWGSKINSNVRTSMGIVIGTDYPERS